MTIDFTCQKCEASFELDAESLIEGEAKLVCPNCHTKAPSGTVDDFVAALSEMRNQVAALSKRFTVNMAVETEDLDEELESDEDDEADDDELDFDEDDEDLDDEEADDEDDR